MATSDFLQWNPPAANQENDAAYAADALRSGGIPSSSSGTIFPSATANKLFYQVTTFIAALSNSLVAKGFTLNDASLTALAAVLSNIVVAGDSVTLNNLIVNTLLAASVHATTGMASDGGILSGKVGTSVGSYGVVDGSLTQQNGGTFTFVDGASITHHVIGGIVID